MTQLSQTHAAQREDLLADQRRLRHRLAGRGQVPGGQPGRQRSRPRPADPAPASDSPATIAHSAAKASGLKPLPGACTTGKTVQLDPEAIENIHAATQSGTGDAAQALGYTGAGVKVAFIADGLNTNNPDFIRANGQHVFVDYQDFSGPAPTPRPAAARRSSTPAPSPPRGARSTTSPATASGSAPPCKIRILGVAPGASLVGLNVFGSADAAYNSVFLEAINYAVNHDHVNVINESFGDNPFPDTASLDLTKMADDAAVKAGVTVTVSTGDAGPTNTIGSPATDPNVISAGASTTYRAYAQTGIGGITAPGVKGWIDNNISGLSSGGFAQNGATVDVVAPGDLNWALCTANPALYGDCTDFAGNGPRSSCRAAPARPRRSRPGPPRWSSRPTARRTTAPPRPRPWSSRSSCPPPRTSTPRATSRGPA